MRVDVGKQAILSLATTSLSAEKSARRWMKSGARVSGLALSTEVVAADILLVDAAGAPSGVSSRGASLLFSFPFSFVFAVFATIALAFALAIFADRASNATSEGLCHFLTVPIQALQLDMRAKPAH